MEDSKAISIPIKTEKELIDEIYGDLDLNLHHTVEEDKEGENVKKTFEYRSFVTKHPKLLHPVTMKLNQTIGYSILVGNLTWYTTDVDMIEAAHHCGSKDILNVKFAENRTNGLSKGIALIEVQSEECAKNLKEKLPFLLIHGNIPEIIDDMDSFNKFGYTQKKSEIIPDIANDDVAIEKDEENKLNNDVQPQACLNNSIDKTLQSVSELECKTSTLELKTIDDVEIAPIPSSMETKSPDVVKELPHISLDEKVENIYKHKRKRSQSNRSHSKSRYKTREHLSSKRKRSRSRSNRKRKRSTSSSSHHDRYRRNWR